ncbi:MAG: diadenylate cyclase CdaA [Eubacteriales bacterium]|nr:diadenylate cyclase CdaA [Eubacteriales bacterium]
MDGGVFNTILSGLQLFDWHDALDIIIIAFLLYKLIGWTRETRAYEVIKGVALLFVFSVISRLLQTNTLSWVLDSILQSGSIIIVLFILFQPEIRRVLEKLGRSGKQIGRTIAEASKDQNGNEVVRDIQRTLLHLSKRRVGALLVFEQKTGLGDIVSTGTRLEAILTGALIENIFEPNTPLHDGAIIIRGQTIVAASCFLPLSDDYEISRELGTRHRAALGVSTVSDCIVIIVSEETGAISMARDGKLVRYLDSQAVHDVLESIFVKQGAGFPWAKSKAQKPANKKSKNGGKKA